MSVTVSITAQTAKDVANACVEKLIAEFPADYPGQEIPTDLKQFVHADIVDIHKLSVTFVQSVNLDLNLWQAMIKAAYGA